MNQGDGKAAATFIEEPSENDRTAEKTEKPADDLRRSHADVTWAIEEQGGVPECLAHTQERCRDQSGIARLQAQKMAIASAN